MIPPTNMVDVTSCEYSLIGTQFLWRVVLRSSKIKRSYTAVSRKVVRKSARENPERYYGWFWVHCFSKKFEKMAGEIMDIRLWLLKESNQSRFDSYSVRNSALNISHITFRDCRMHIFPTIFLEIAVNENEMPSWRKSLYQPGLMHVIT